MYIYDHMNIIILIYPCYFNCSKDFIIFPGDAEIKAISQCTTGRVVLLKFKDTNRKCFYWLQEPKEEKDEEYLKKVQTYMKSETYT